jgi:hypothetical protein
MNKVRELGFGPNRGRGRKSYGRGRGEFGA